MVVVLVFNLIRTIYNKDVDEANEAKKIKQL